MTRGDLIALLSVRFGTDYIGRIVEQVLSDDATELLYAVATQPHEGLSVATLHRIRFGGAYALERIYFADPEQFEPCVADFLAQGFVACTDASARRHFGKIMADLLARQRPVRQLLEPIAEAAANWAVDPATKVAVRIWAVEVLKCCREIPWVEELWADLLETMSHNATAGIRSRMRTSWSGASN